MITKEQIAAFREQKTPFYFYDLGRLQSVLDALKIASQQNDFHVHYAVKANANQPILKLISENGLGADCVSGEEVKRTMECGFDASKIAFAGVGKSDEEINLGLEHDIFSFNVESVQELEIINELAKKSGKIASIALRINPDVNANTHKYITTGLEENKFGINVWELTDVLELLRKYKHLKLTGIHFHIGSQITDLSAFKQLCIRINELQQWFVDRKVIVEHVNVGGGLGIDYQFPDEKLIPDFANYFRIFKSFLELQPKQEVHFELGRAIVASSGDLISKVLFIKNGVKTNFAILDAGMTELIRPALYQAYHKIENITSNSTEFEKYDVVGPICESSDCFGKAVELPQTQRGDLIAIRAAGAYGEVMTSGYNLRVQNPPLYWER